QKWRALLLAIKSKLESVSSGIESCEEAFLAHVVMPDGITVGQHARPRIESAYKGAPMMALLPGPNSRQEARNGQSPAVTGHPGGTESDYVKTDKAIKICR